MNSDSIRALLIRAHIVLLYQKATIFRRRRWIIVWTLTRSSRSCQTLLCSSSLCFFRRRTVILAVAAVSVLIVAGVVVGLLYGLNGSKTFSGTSHHTGEIRMIQISRIMTLRHVVLVMKPTTSRVLPFWANMFEQPSPWIMFTARESAERYSREKEQQWTPRLQRQSAMAWWTPIRWGLAVAVRSWSIPSNLRAIRDLLCFVLLVESESKPTVLSRYVHNLFFVALIIGLSRGNTPHSPPILRCSSAVSICQPVVTIF